ncbi:MAG: phosphate signaling complex protein PhoU [Psychroflexus sp.]
MRKEYFKTIKGIENQMLEMALKSEESIEKAMDSLINRDLTLAEDVIENDIVINNMEIQIEMAVVKLLTLENPVARDFRRVSSVFKIITDLERIGDLAVNIAKISIEIGDEAFIKPLIDLPRMYEIVREMLSRSLKAFVENDVALATEVAEKDDVVDDLHLMINEELLQMIADDSKIMDQAMKLMFISRYLERIADHVTNICERIIYIETNRVSKHEF